MTGDFKIPLTRAYRSKDLLNEVKLKGALTFTFVSDIAIANLFSNTFKFSSKRLSPAFT